MKKKCFSLSAAIFLLSLFYGCAGLDRIQIIPEHALQAQIDALPAGVNHEIRLEPGIYELTAPLVLPSGLRLIGQGPDTILLAAPGLSFPLITNRDRETGNAEIVLEALTLDGAGNRRPLGDKDLASRLGQPDPNRMGNTGIYLKNVHSALLKNLCFRDFQQEATILTGCSGVQMLGNIFLNCAQKNNQPRLTAGAVYMDRSDDCLLTKNSFKQCYEGGIFLGLNCNRNIIADNRGELLPGGPGIAIDCGNDNLVMGNLFWNTASFNDLQPAAILVKGGQNNFAGRNIILANQLEQTGCNGIMLVATEETRIIRNIVRSAGENLQDDNAGLAIVRSRRVLVQNNRIEEGYGPGVRIIDSNEVRLLFNHIRKNRGPALTVNDASTKVTERLNEIEGNLSH